MAVLHSIQSGNLTDATTWGVVDNTSYLNSIASSTLLTTTQTNSSAAFTPGAITISGIAIQFLGRITSPTGTVTMRLWNNTAGTTVKDVTINASDLPSTGGTGSTNGYIGWVYFKFDTNVTLLAATAYTIRMFSSVNSEVSVYRDGTANNHSRALITTTTAAPANTDTLIVSGEHTAAGVNSTYTVTMNSTSNTNGYGLNLGAKSIFQYGTAASTNYKFRLSQSNLLISAGATFKIGDSATPIPSSSTAEFEFTCASPGQFSIDNYGTFTTYGATVTHRALLAADIAAGATTSTTDISTGWKNGDLIVFPSTTRTYSQYEVETLTADASGTTLTHTATANAHGGDSVSMVQADLANLTRNIKFFSTSTANRGYIQFLNSNSNASIFYTSFVDLGFSTTTAGIRIAAGSFDFQYNSYYATANASYVAFSTVTGLTSRTISNNVFYNLGATAFTLPPITGAGSGTVPILDDNNVVIGMLCTAANPGVVGTIGSNNVISSCAGNGLQGNMANGASGNSIYSNGNNGWLGFGLNTSVTISNVKIWRNANFAILNNLAVNNRETLLTIDNLNVFGNVNNFICGTTASQRVLIKNSYVWGGSTLVTAYGVGVSSAVVQTEMFIFQNTVFGRRPDNVDSFFTIACIASGIQQLFTFYDCSFYGTVAAYFTYAFTPYYITNGYMSFNHNNVAGDHRQFQIRGLLQTDTTYSTTGKSIRLTPQVTQQKTYSSTYRVAVKAGNTCTVTMQVRKSAAPDTVYNGAQPRLMLMMNLLAGITTETVCATATAASNGAWETLTYTSPAVTSDCVLEFYVDCDGTAGFINVDNFRTTTFVDTRNGTYLTPIGSYIEADWRKPGGNYGFVN